MILIVVGTRPEIIKMATVVDSCRELGVGHKLVNTGQHHDWEMSGQFMRELGLERPDHYLNVGSGSHAVQTSRTMVELEKVVLREHPDAVVAEGDTNTVLAAALTSIKLHVPVCHVEAGLRSYDLRMPEEHNRRLVDHASTLLFAPSLHAAANLRKEKVWGKVLTVGNTVIDACLRFMDVATKKSTVLLRVEFDRFALATFHRAENVDHLPTLRTFVEVLARCPVPVVFPVHPRTMSRLKSSGLITKLKNSKNVQVLPPVGYFDILTLMRECEFILTDSGGLQEEATAPNIRKFVFVLRKLTDRPESIGAGFAKLVGAEDAESIVRSVESLPQLKSRMKRKSPYGDGMAGLRIARALKSQLFSWQGLEI